MACPNDYKAIMDRGTRAFNATLKDMECVLIGYKNEIFRLNNELAKEKRKNARLEAKKKELADVVRIPGGKECTGK